MRRLRATNVGRLGVALCALGALLVASWLYAPLQARPFDILDFGEIIPLFKAAPSFAGRVLALARYFATQGRMNWLAYAALSSDWTMYSWNVVGWQVSRFVLMCAVCVAAYVVLRRLGCSRAASVAGTSVFVISGAAAPTWLRLTAGEPAGTLLLLAAIAVGTSYQRVTRWGPSLFAMALAIGAALLVKEMLAAVVPVVVFVAMSGSPDGGSAWPRANARNVALVAATFAVGAAVLLPAALVVRHAPAGAYATAYGTATVGALDAIVPILRTVFPFEPIDQYPTAALVIADAAWVGILVTGIHLALRDARPGTVGPRLLAALALPALGALAYLPWPDYHLFYAFPFLLGSALLLALALSAIERKRPRIAPLWYGAWMVACLYAGTAAHRVARRTDAVQRVMASAVRTIASFGGADSMLVAVRRPAAAQAWQGLGPTLWRYGRAFGYDMPPVRDVPCMDGLRRARGQLGRSVLVIYSGQCASVGMATRRLSAAYAWYDWDRLRVSVDSLQVDVVASALIIPREGAPGNRLLAPPRKQVVAR